MLADDSRLYEAEATLLCVLLAGIGLALLVRTIRSRRPALDLRLVLGLAFGLRVAVVLAQSLLGSTGESLRGTDDPVSLGEANLLANTPLDDHLWDTTVTGDFHLALFAIQMKLLGAPGGTSLRVVQAAVAVAAIALLALAVERFAGRRAALAAAWFVAIEPTSVLFTTILHKESLVLLGEGLFLLGVAICWSRRLVAGPALMLGGVGLVLLVRPYAGYFLLAAALTLLAYVFAKRLRLSRAQAVAAAAAAAVLFGGAFLALSNDPLAKAQSLQSEEPADNDNLQLEPVDFTTASGLAKGLPRRIRDFLVRPYPWQADNLSQRLGVVGTLVAWGLYLLLAYALLTSGRAALARAGPFLFTAATLTVCYAFSTANAGTGYRHRIHLLFVLAAAVSTLLADRLPALSALRARLERPRPAATA